MAGKLQLAAKCLLGTTLLGSGIGGVYYATTHGWTSHPTAAKQRASNLDAVASAWAGADTKHAADSDQSSRVARSAQTKLVADPKPIAKPAETDRYAAAPIPLPGPEVAAKHEDKQDKKADAKKTAKVEKAKQAKQEKKIEPIEPTLAEAKIETKQKSKDAAVKLASHTEETKTAKTDEAKSPTPVLPAPVVLVPAVAVPEPTIARGQEPKDDSPAPPTQAKGVSAEISGAFDAAPKAPTALSNTIPKEPKTLNATGQPTNAANPSQGAKQAFGGSAAPAALDRYGDNSLPSPPPAGQSKPMVNPFAAPPPTTTPTNTQSPQNDRLAPLSNPGGDAGSLREMQPNGNGLRPMNASPSNSNTTNSNPSPQRSATRDYSSKNRLPQASPFANTPNNNNASPYSPSPQRGTGLAGGADATPQTMSGDGTGKPGEKALEGVQQPTLVIQKFAPGEIQVGKPAKFVLQVRNSGAQAADNVTVQDDVPQGTQLVSTSPNASVQGTHLAWQLGKLSPGEDRTIEMQVMPKSEGDIGSVATVTYSAQASVRTRCTMPQLAIRMTAPSEVMVGKQQHVKIEIRNPGSGDATGVMLLENVPPGVKHAAGPSLEFEIGTLHAGETRELDLVLNAEKPGKVTNVLTARAQGNLQVQQQVEFEVIAPGLTVGLQGPERRYLERPATYEVSVQNPGTATAHDVQIVTKLPKGMRFVKANNMGEYDANTHAVYWSLAELPKGEKGTVELTAMPIETGPQTLQVESRAQQGLADKTQREVIVEGLAAIKFEVRSLQDPVEVNGEAGYEIRIINQGTKAASNVQVTAELPPGFKLTSAEGETQHKADGNRLVFEPLQQLAPKADTVYRIRAQAMQAGDQRLVVEVKTDDLEQPIRREENTRVFGDQ
jgi:uncharacterized repeat protein (TIGR01451 family)